MRYEAVQGVNDANGMPLLVEKINTQIPVNAF